jgi:predicted proteasome-type protease
MACGQLQHHLCGPLAMKSLPRHALTLLVLLALQPLAHAGVLNEQQTSLSEACKCVLVSFDSTMRSNLSVGPPLDLLLYRRDSFTANLRQRLVEDDPYLQTIRREWNETLRRGVRELPGPEWLRDAEG